MGSLGDHTSGANTATRTEETGERGKANRPATRTRSGPVFGEPVIGADQLSGSR